VRVLVTGGAGFLGSHLTRALLARGDAVVVLDNFSTSEPASLADLAGHDLLAVVDADVCARPTLRGPFAAVAHLACPASPPDYLRLPLATLASGSYGSDFVLEVARSHGARVLLASTSEVYGNPEQCPQSETYWGSVNPIGPRSVYDESKRFAEATFMAHRRARRTNTGIVRIFNTYGPGLRPHDGRVVSNFIAQALRGDSLSIYGNGTQTRSFCYVDDLVSGLLAMLDNHLPGPINLGNPNEITVLELAELVLRLTRSSSKIVHRSPIEDDPVRRCPDISLASHLLKWAPTVSLEEGLKRTIAWQRSLGSAEIRTHEDHLVGASDV
jgi:dTDP-glucose 4,6-dehydratase